MTQTTLVDKVLARVLVTSYGCVEWVGCTTPNGYGLLRDPVSKKNLYVHRIIYEHFYKKKLGVLTVDHLCRNRKCCNPLHFEAVERGENSRRGMLGSYRKKRTHCKRGHEFINPLLAVDPKNNRVYRRCRVCSYVSTYASKKRLRREKASVI